MSELPFIDAHTVAVAATPERVFEAVGEVVARTFDGPGPTLFGRVVGCTDKAVVRSGDGGPPEAIIGFHLAHAERPSLIALQGRHHFSRYELRFVIEPGTLRAESRAAFPGLSGRLYRLAVIGTRVHVFATRRLLRAVKRRAERSGV
jgi:hypothetical protein